MGDGRPPRAAVFAGINGAGKSTASRHVLVDVLDIRTFTNADAIARGLNGIDPEGEALRASRVMLAHLHEQAAAREDIAFETTLAARTYAGWLRGLRDSGYEVYLYYFRLDSPEAAIERVATTSRTRWSASATRARSGTSSSCTNRSVPSGRYTITVRAGRGWSRR